MAPNRSLFIKNNPPPSTKIKSDFNSDARINSCQKFPFSTILVNITSPCFKNLSHIQYSAIIKF